MTTQAERSAEERFLVLAPFGRDGALTCNLLERAGLAACSCVDMEELCRYLVDEGAAGAMFAEEALTAGAQAQLRALLVAQPSWSDLPILVFTAGLGESRQPRLRQLMEALGNLTLLDRPLRPVTMLSAARAALRARKRQYLARAELLMQQRAVEQRDQFLAMLGHELRNPLAAISMAVELNDENHLQYRAIVRRQARHLTRLVDDLLDVSRVTSGKIVLQRVPVDLHELIKRTVQAQHAQIAQRGLHVQIVGSDEPALVLGDSVRLEQIVANLLNNAVKYTPEHGHVRITLTALPGWVQLAVEDDGVGIASDMLPRVFDLFAQASATLDRAQGGMGIGLTLVKRLVELHGGEIGVHSPGIGRGSTFTLRLPRTSGPDVSPTLRPDSAPSRAEPRDILVVEDNDDSRELLSALLRRAGHHVQDAADGLAGVELALAETPQVILIDIGLPGLDGYAVARRVRRALGRDVLLVALTGYGQPDDQARALDAGFDVHLTKPVDFARLERLIASDSHPAAPS